MKPIRNLIVGALALALAAPGTAAQDAAADTSAANWWLLDAGDGYAGISAERAYRDLLAGRAPRDTVVVAIIDSGVETTHPALLPYLWRNPGEIPGNGVDDDGNGYVDDVHGWNFISGPGGNVTFDTYEVTRLYARMAPRWEGASPDTLSPAAREEWALWERVRADFTSKRDEYSGLVVQVRQIEAVVTAAETALQRAVGGGSLTPERVRALNPATPALREARALYLELLSLGLTPEQLREERASIEGRLRYSLDPAFDPRHLVGDDYADGSQLGYGTNDYIGPDATHGTHVAGIVTTVAGRGMAESGGPIVRIMTLRAVPDGDERDKDVAAAIRYAVDNGARVVNLSFGKAYSPEKALVDDAVRYAERRGVLVVHAAGNDAADLAMEPSFPIAGYLDGGEAANWIEVGATSWEGGESLAAPFSNFGRDQVDVFAPGVAILSTVTDGGFARLEGTSMAAPVVSGIAATVMSYFPELSATEVKEVILRSAVPMGAQTVVLPGTEDERVPFSELSRTGAVANLYEALRLAERMVAERR